MVGYKRERSEFLYLFTSLMSLFGMMSYRSHKVLQAIFPWTNVCYEGRKIDHWRCGISIEETPLLQYSLLKHLHKLNNAWYNKFISRLTSHTPPTQRLTKGSKQSCTPSPAISSWYWLLLALRAWDSGKVTGCSTADTFDTRESAWDGSMEDEDF